MSDVVSWCRYFEVEIDWRAAGLVTLFLVVIAGSLALRPSLTANGVEPALSGASAQEQAAAGAGWALGEAIFAAVLLLLILAFRRLPEWVRSLLAWNGTIFLAMVLGAGAFADNTFWAHAALVMGGYTLLKTTDQFDIWWVVNNVLCLAVAVGIGALLGITFGPWMLAAGLVGLSIYDYVFADRESWMFTLGSAFLNWRIPVIFVAPKSLQFDWSELADSLDDDEDTEDEVDSESDELLGFGIGTADLALPAAFVVSLSSELSVSVSSGLPVVAVIVGILVACLRMSWKMRNKGSGAGLPPLTSGALGGWMVGTLVVVLL